jgi:hypothetical protein
MDSFCHKKKQGVAIWNADDHWSSGNHGHYGKTRDSFKGIGKKTLLMFGDADDPFNDSRNPEPD